MSATKDGGGEQVIPICQKSYALQNKDTMTAPLLTTKLHIPPPRPRERIVPRPRLIERLDQGIHPGCKLVLVSAPAGFGKTTLLSEWVGSKTQEHKKSAGFAWVSLDKDDNDLDQFLAYLVTAIQTVESSLGNDILPAIQSPRVPSAQTVLSTLINDLVE